MVKDKDLSEMKKIEKELILYLKVKLMGYEDSSSITHSIRFLILKIAMIQNYLKNQKYNPKIKKLPDELNFPEHQIIAKINEIVRHINNMEE